MTRRSIRAHRRSRKRSLTVLLFALYYYSTAIITTDQTAFIFFQTASALTVTGVTLKLALDQQWNVADGPAPQLQQQQQKSRQPPSPPQLSQRFTSEASLDLVHRLRRDCQGVLVGRMTVVRDDCSLTVRRVPLLYNNNNNQQQQQPTRVVIDPQLSLLLPLPHDEEEEDTISASSFVLPNYQIFRDGYRTLLYHAVRNVDPNILAAGLPDSVTCIYLPSSSSSGAPLSSSSSSIMSPHGIWNHLQQHYAMSHLLIEGGPTTALHCLDIVDRILLIRAPIQFQNQPVVSSHMSNELLQERGFVCLGKALSPADGGVDTLEYWTRPNMPWPTPILTDWP